MRRHEGPSPKSLDSDKILSSNMSYFVVILRFVAIYPLFEYFRQEKCFFAVENSVFLCKKCTIIHIGSLGIW